MRPAVNYSTGAERKRAGAISTWRDRTGKRDDPRLRRGSSVPAPEKGTARAYYAEARSVYPSTGAGSSTCESITTSPGRSTGGATRDTCNDT